MKLKNLTVGQEFRNLDLTTGSRKSNIHFHRVGKSMYIVSNCTNILIVARSTGNGHGIVISITTW